VVRIAVRVLAKVVVFKAVGMGDVLNGGVWEDDATVRNIEMLTGYRARVEVDEFIYRIDGGVTEECFKREVRYLYRFWGYGSCVDGGGFTVIAAVCAAVTSVAAAVSILAKVFWRLLLMCQVG
jgi:hypothetical protein